MTTTNRPEGRFSVSKEPFSGSAAEFDDNGGNMAENVETVFPTVQVPAPMDGTGP